MSLKEHILSLLGMGAPSPGPRSGVIRASRPHPVVRYVDELLLRLARSTPGSELLRASTPLPQVQGASSPEIASVPGFDQVVNRLKVLAGLPPMTCKAPVQKTFECSVEGRQLRVECLFADSADDPSCTVAVTQP